MSLNGVAPQSWIRGWLESYGVRAVMNPRAITLPDPAHAPTIKAELARRNDEGGRRRKLVGRWCPHGPRYHLGLEASS